MIKQIKKSRVKIILSLMILVLGLFIVSEFLTKSFDNRSKAAEEIEESFN